MREEDQDAADAARVVTGDLSAFEGIVRRWQHRLVSMAWRFCHDRAMAEDLAQEVFLKAFRALASFRGESAFSTWLTSIAVNTYRSRLGAEGQPLLSVDPARFLGAEPGRFTTSRITSAPSPCGALFSRFLSAIGRRSSCITLKKKTSPRPHVFWASPRAH
jgi:hypothetical protein